MTMTDVFTKCTINRLLRKFADTGAVNRLTDSGRPALKKMLTLLTTWI